VCVCVISSLLQWSSSTGVRQLHLCHGRVLPRHLQSGSSQGTAEVCSVFEAVRRHQVGFQPVQSINQLTKICIALTTEHGQRSLAVWNIIEREDRNGIMKEIKSIETLVKIKTAKTTTDDFSCEDVINSLVLK